MDHAKVKPVDAHVWNAEFPVPASVEPHAAPARGVAVPPRHPALDAPPDLPTLLAAFRRRWVSALVVAVVAAGTFGPLAWFVIPPSKYTAQSSLRVATAPRRIMFEPKDGNADPFTYQQTVLALLKNQYIIGHALNSPKLSGLPTFQKLARQDVDVEEWLAKNLKAQFQSRSEILDVSLSGDYPDDLAAIVNAVVDSYMTLVVKEEKDSRLARLEKLKELWGRYQRELNVKRKSLKEVAASVGSGDHVSFAIAQQFKSSQLSLAQSEHSRTQTELLKAQAELATLENVREHGETAGRGAPAPIAVPEVDLESLVERHPGVLAAREDLGQIQRQFDATRRKVRDQADPALLHIAQKRRLAQAALADARKRARTDLSERLEPAAPGQPLGTAQAAAAERHRAVARVRAQIEVLEGYQKALAENVERLQREVQDGSKNSLDLETERQEIAIANDFAQKVGAEVEAVQVEMDAPDRVQVLSVAKPPKLKDESRRIKAAGGAALASFALSILGISFWEFRARRIDHHDDVVRVLGLKLVGTLPDPSRRMRQLPAPGSRTAASEAPRAHWQDPLVESVNATRTMLLHASHQEAVRVVMVTSAVKGEGKTSLSCHLATSLARTGRRIALVDCDLRSPAVHRLFDLPLVDGLCEVLRGETAAMDALKPTEVPNLHVITAGRCDAAAIHALSRDMTAALFQRLKAEYDFVIVDSAPVLPLADSLLIAQGVDAAMFSLLRHHSRLPLVHAARERLAVLGVKVLGAVVNGARDSGFNQYYASDSDATVA